MARTLQELSRDWEAWAASAKKVEEGWQADYPSWDEFLAAAEKALIQPELTEDEVHALDLCWAISEESEALMDFAESHLDQCWRALRTLAHMGQPHTRWQIYAVLGSAAGSSAAETLLRQGLDDPDSYCRRRALISLARFQPVDAKQLSARFLSDPDPYLRQAAIEMVRVSNDPGFIGKAKEQLRADSASHVRQAAETLGAGPTR